MTEGFQLLLSNSTCVTASRERERDRTAAAAAAATENHSSSPGPGNSDSTGNFDSVSASSAAAAGAVKPRHLTGAAVAAALAESAYDNIVRFLPPACEAGAYTRSDCSST